MLGTFTFIYHKCSRRSCKLAKCELKMHFSTSFVVAVAAVVVLVAAAVAKRAFNQIYMLHIRRHTHCGPCPCCCLAALGCKIDLCNCCSGNWFVYKRSDSSSHIYCNSSNMQQIDKFMQREMIASDKITRQTMRGATRRDKMWGDASATSCYNLWHVLQTSCGLQGDNRELAVR